MKKALLMIGGGYHPFAACGEILADRLKEFGSTVCTMTEDRDAFLKLDDYEVVIAYTQGGKLTDAQEKSLCDWVAAGGAFVGIHCANDSWVENERYMEMIGTQFTTHGPIAEFRVEIADADHLITRNLEPFSVTDEFYITRSRTEAELHSLMTGSWQCVDHSMTYVREYGKGRVFYTALGHDQRVFNEPAFIQLVHRGIAWTTDSIQASPVRFGVVGYGPSFDMGKLHADTIRATAGLELRAVCDIDPKRLEAADKEQPGVKLFPSVTDLARADEIDVAVIVTPHDSHVAVALELIEAGIGVVCEKPFSLTRNEATRMIEAARARNVLLSTFHNRRLDADFRAIRKAVADGLIGEVFQIEVAMGQYSHPGYWWRSHKPISGGAIYDWGAHMTDWVLNLMPGKLESVTGFFGKYVWHDVTNEDHCRAILRFEGNRNAEVEISFLSAIAKPRWRVLGTRGSLVLDGWEPPIRVTSHSQGWPVSLELPFLPCKRDPRFYAALSGHLLAGEPIPISPESARKVITVLELAEKSSRTGQAEPFPEDN